MQIFHGNCLSGRQKNPSASWENSHTVTCKQHKTGLYGGQPEPCIAEQWQGLVSFRTEYRRHNLDLLAPRSYLAGNDHPDRPEYRQRGQGLLSRASAFPGPQFLLHIV